MVLSTNRYVWGFLLAISIFFAGFFWVLFYFQDIFIILVLGAVLLLINERLLSLFNRVMDRSPGLNRKAVGITLIIFTVLFSVYIVGNELHTFSSLITEAAKVKQDYLSGSSAFFGNESEFAKLKEMGFLRPEDLQAVGNSIFSGLTETISKISYYILSGVLIIPLMFSLYYRHRHNLDCYVCTHIPPKHAEVVLRALKSMGKELEDFFSAKMMESAVVGFICCTGFYLAGIDGWFFLGALAGFLNIIPYIGPIIGAIPPIIVGYFNSFEAAVLAAATVLVAQLVDNFYLSPFMISEKVNINPLLSVVLTLAASQALGILGMVFAIPIFIVYKIIILESYRALVKIYPDGNSQDWNCPEGKFEN